MKELTNYNDVMLERNHGLLSICDRKPSRCCLRLRSCCSEDLSSSMVTSPFVSCGPGEEDQTSKNDSIVSIPASIMSFGKSLPMWSTVYYRSVPVYQINLRWPTFVKVFQFLSIFSSKLRSTQSHHIFYKNGVLLTLTMSSGNLASCATWIPKLWSEIPTVDNQ